MSQKQKTPLQLSLLFTLLAWSSAFYALWHQISLTSGTATETAFCNINSYVNCDAVALSPYANLFGLPLASLAMAFFACLFVLLAQLYFAYVDRNTDEVQKLAPLSFWMVIAALPVTTAYAVISLFLIKSLCISCLSIYLLHVLLLWSTWKFKKSQAITGKKLKFALPLSGGAMAAFAIIAGLNLLAPKFLNSSMASKQNQYDKSTLALYIARHLGNPQQNFDLSKAPTVGTESAPVTVVVFSDFQCPYCKLASSVVPTVARSYGDKVRIVYKDFPLSSECNAEMTHTGHPYACSAAKVARCVAQNLGNEAYQKASRALYDKQESLGVDTIKAIGKNAGLSDTQITECLTNLNIHEAIAADVREGAAAKVESTPSIFVNGRRLDSAVNPQILRMAIDHYLNR